MSKRKLIMMLNVLVITILTVSGFYVLTGEANLDKIINVTSSKTTDGDWAKVYEEGAPYGSGKNTYYIKYTGAETGRTTVDLGEEKAGLTVGEDGYPRIFNNKITSTYKMFSKNGTASGSTKDPEKDVTRVYVPASIAITSDPNKEANKGISSNTFEGCGQDEIDVIYHTPQLSNPNERATGLSEVDYDRTEKINKSNVITYVYLGKENIDRKTDFTSETWQYAKGHCYNGGIKNVYVSSDVNNISALFHHGSSLLDGTETMIKYLLLDENGTWTNIYGLLEGQSEFVMTQNFTVPQTIKNMHSAFRDTDITFNKNYKFKIPKSAEIIENAFYNCAYLKGTFTIPETVTNMNNCFLGAGTNATDYSTEKPIVMEYQANCIPALAYRSNVDKLERGGKVSKKLYDWEIIYDDNGTYEYKANGVLISKYYIHYRGSATTVDLEIANTDNQLTVDSNKIVKIFGIEITNTYRMFAKNNVYDSNDKLYRVFIPSSVAFNTVTNGGIKENMFSGCGSQVIDCIYRTPIVDDINPRGSGLTSKYDKTEITYENATGVTTYVSLDNNNIKRVNLNGVGANSYSGTIKNVYISNEVDLIAHLFDHGADKSGQLIENVLLDETGKWKNLEWMFASQEITKLPQHFKINQSATSLYGMFCNGELLESLPNNFTIPDNVINCYRTFEYCVKLSATVTFPIGVTNMDQCFLIAGSKSTSKIGDTNKPIVMNYYDNSTSAILGYSESTVYKKSLGTYSGKATQSIADVASAVVTGDEDTVVNTDTTQESSSEKVVIEDETEWVTVTVNKKSVDEVVTETQASSNSVENVSEENKEEEGTTSE